MSKSDLISVTPLIGGKSNGGGVCSLLEIGSVKILLDCGCSSDDNNQEFLHVVDYIKQIHGSISAILISHADMHHMGALPLLLGENGIKDIPIICTLPVYKFGQVLLYDHLMNQLMEGNEQLLYGFDDIDQAFSKVLTVKFNQSINIPNNQNSIISVCALRSGRTIGGSMWKIRCGPTEILYMMDINLKKEMVLDNVSLDILPASPALMIVEGNCIHQGTTHMNTTASNISISSGTIHENGDRLNVLTTNSNNTMVTASTRRGKKDKDESSILLSFILEKMRNNSNVLIPCETVGRTLEIMQLLGKYWFEQKLGMYNLIFLSHMAKNVREFACMQLEWMSDSLSKGFYNGKPNPFELPQIHFLTSIKEMERHCPGPKVVLATDNGLSYGLSKELLLKWGGDPRCCVIFTDNSDHGSLAADIRMKYQHPPVIATIRKPVRVELIGNELVQYRIEQEKQRRLKEENMQRKRRQEELSKFHVNEEVELIDDEDDIDLSQIESNHISAIATPGMIGSTNNIDINNNGTMKKKLKTDIVNKFLEPSFLMFESRDINLTIDEYGASVDDLVFKDIQSVDVKWLTKDKNISETDKASGVEINLMNNSINNNTNIEDDDNDDNDNDLDLSIIPTKLVSTTMKVQFTCEFKEFNLSGRIDFKAIKAITSKITPSRICILRGNENDSNTFLTYMKSINIHSYAPKNYQKISFEVKTEKLKLQVSQSLLPSSMKIMKSFSTITNTLIDSKCSITPLPGVIEESRLASLQDIGTKVMKYQGIQNDLGGIVNESKGGSQLTFETTTTTTTTTTTSEQQINIKTTSTNEDELDGDIHINNHMSTNKDINMINLNDEQLDIQDPLIGVVSLGEVTLNSLRYLIAANGINVEFRIDSLKGAVLVCDEQVIIRKENTSDFIIEGPPIPAFYEARKALYQQFAFV